MAPSATRRGCAGTGSCAAPRAGGAGRPTPPTSWRWSLPRWPSSDRGCAISRCATPSAWRREAAMRRALVILACAAACRSIPDAPTAIAYDREACAHCHMLIGDPRYAAQLVTEAGDVLDFDDPGCALRY